MIRSASFTMLFACLVACFAVTTLQVSATLANPMMFILTHKPIKTARVDPIISPGAVSSHVHTFVGANGVSPNTTTADLLKANSNCTTAPLTDDMSSYWAPTLYSVNPNGTFTPNKLGYTNTYYLMRGNVQITAFPQGFQMVAGNSKQTAPGPTKQSQSIVSFVCLDYKNGSSQGPTFPQKPCPQGLRLQIVFPSCWNGQDLYKKDMSHVVYPNGTHADTGPCPSTHTTRLPTLFYEFVFQVDGQDNTGNSTWVLSNGDAIGYSFHADFLAAWNVTTLQNAIDQCAGNLFNGIDKCPPLAASINPTSVKNCKAVSTEATSGALASLPGCNMIFNGPHAGKGLTAGCDPNNVMVKPVGAVSAESVSSSSTTTTTSTTTTSSTKSTSTKTSSTKTTTSSSSPRSISAASMAKKSSTNKKPTKKSTKKSSKKHNTVVTAKKNKRPSYLSAQQGHCT